MVWPGFSPMFSKATQKRDVSAAQIGLCRVVLALKAHKYEGGQYPATLEDLQKTLGWTLPEDPFSGKGFVYQPKGKGFKLYSIGPNLKDDGGIGKKRGARAWESPEDDIVWECVR